MPDWKWSGILFFNELWFVQQALWVFGYKITNALSFILSTHWLALFCHLFLPQFPSALKTGKEMLSSPENTTKAKNNKKGYWYWFWNDNSYGLASSSLTQPTFLLFQIRNNIGMNCMGHSCMFSHQKTPSSSYTFLTAHEIQSPYIFPFYHPLTYENRFPSLPWISEEQ